MFTLTNCTLIDGTGREPQKGASVVIEKNLISEVGIQVENLTGDTVVDLKGLVLMPGLIDLHVHCGGIVHLKEGEPNFVDMKSSNKYSDLRELSILAENWLANMTD